MTDIPIIILAGIAGTALMTLFMDIASRITGYRFPVPRILGTMITSETKPSGALSDSAKAMVAGYAAHYAIGIMFALIYLSLWQKGICAPVFSGALLFGALNGLFAVAFWWTFIKLHPLAPAVRLEAYLVFIFLAHLVFACGVVFVYSLLS